MCRSSYNWCGVFVIDIYRNILFPRFIALGLCLSILGCGGQSGDPEKESFAPGKDPKAITSADTSQAEAVNLAPETVKELRFSPKVNEVYQHKFSQTTKVDQNGAQSYEKLTQYYTKVVKAIKQDKSIEVSMRIDSIFIEKKVTAPNTQTKSMAATYNSNNATDRKNDEFRQFNAVVGQEVTVIISPLGKVEEVAGFTPIFNKMLGDKKDSVAPQMKEYLMDQMKLQLFEAPLQQEIQTFPADGKLDSNATWSRTDVIPLYGFFTVRNNVQYKVVGLKKIKGRTLATVRANLVSKVVGRGDTRNGVAMKLNKSQMGGTGEAMIDLETGVTIFKRNEVNTQFQITATDSLRGRSEDMVQSTTSTVTIERIR